MSGRPHPQRVGLLAALALLLLRAAAAPAVSPAPLEDEAGILQALRRSLHDAGAQATVEMFGWQHGNPAVHCEWEWVLCDGTGHVTSLTIAMAASRAANATGGRDQATQEDGGGGGNATGASTRGSSQPALLPPAMARLSRLETLFLQPQGAGKEPLALAAIPAEWGQPGAFPALKRLSVVARTIIEPLPDVHPGALPQLVALDIDAAELAAPLPAWGKPDVLPALLHLSLILQVQGSLSPAWAAGFRQLTYLHIEQSSAAWSSAPIRSTPQHEGGRLLLPPEWASSGGFPALDVLELIRLPVEGSLPTEWVEGGFANLGKLMISGGQLTGTLPPQLFDRHPKLQVLSLEGNRLHGTLPGSYGSSQATILRLASNPNISGPAFPAAWIEPGALPRLFEFDLSGCNITGILPEYLPWPHLKTLKLAGTRVEGSMPDSWCKAPFAKSLSTLWLNNSTASEERPACAARDMPLLHHAEDEASAPSAGFQAEAGEASRRPLALVAILATLVPLAAVAAGSGLLRQWQRQQHAGKQEHLQPDSQSLLPIELQPQRSGSRSSDGTTAAERAPLARRQRVAALLSMRPGRLEMMPFEGLGEQLALAHQLSASSSSSSLTGWQTWTDDLEAGEGGSPAAKAHGRSRVPQPAWRLPTESLRLAPSQLEFVADDNGQLIALGSGSYADVFLARLDGVRVAVKVIELDGMLHTSRVWQEVSLLRQAKHPRIVQLLGVRVEDEMILIAMQLLPRGSLRAALRDPEMRQELQWGRHGRQVALDVAAALDHMHTQFRLLHSDLKCANVLLSEDWRASVSDLGLSQIISTVSRTAVGFSRAYAAPEVLMGERCTLAADVYSFGVLLAFLATGQLSERRGQWRMPRAPEECPEAVVQLIQDCTAREPGQRPTAADALRRLREAG